MMTDNKTGLSPTQRDTEIMMALAAAGDLVFTVYPATCTRVATSAAWSREVRIRLNSASLDCHTWFSGAIANGVSIGDTASGTAAIASTTLTFVHGEAVVTVTGTGAFAATNTDTLTIAQATIMGATVASKTSVQTWTS
jgi:cystathionine beta-lyase/cystathionine gamma-synthase